MQNHFQWTAQYGGQADVTTQEELETLDRWVHLGRAAGGLCAPYFDRDRSAVVFRPEAPLLSADPSVWAAKKKAGPEGPLRMREKTFILGLRSPMLLDQYLDQGLALTPAPTGPVWIITYESDTPSREGADFTLESGEVVRIRRGSDDLEPSFSYRGPGPRHRTKEHVTAWIPAATANEAAEVFGRLLRLHRTLLEVS